MKNTLSPELQSYLSALYKMSLVDGHQDLRELKAIMDIAHKYGVNAENFEDFLSISSDQIVIPDSLEQRITHLYHLAQIVWADGTVEDSERALLHDFVLRYGFLAENAEGITNYLLNQVQAGHSLQDIITELNRA